MAAGRRPKSQVEHEPPPDAEDIRTHYRRNIHAFIDDVIHVRDRDSTRILRLRDHIKPSQIAVLDLYENRRAFNVVRHLDRLRASSDSDERLSYDLAIANLSNYWTDDPARSTNLIAKYGVTKLQELTEARTKLKLGAETRLIDYPLGFIFGKGRQQYFSLTVKIINFHASCFWNVRSATFAHEAETVEKVFGYMRVMYDNWPEDLLWLRPNDPWNGRDTLKFEPPPDRDPGNWHPRSEAIVRTAAGNRALGMTFDQVHFTEYAHYETLDAIAAGKSGIAKHCVVWTESTANGPQGAYYEEYCKAKKLSELITAYKNKDFSVDLDSDVKLFTPWLDDPGYVLPIQSDEERKYLTSTLSTLEQNYMTRFPGVFTLERVKWRRWKMDKLGGHEVLSKEQFVAQEFPVDEVELFQSSGGHVFNPDRLTSMESNASLPMNKPKYFFEIGSPGEKDYRPKRVGAQEQANFTVWERPISYHQYAIGADISTGIGQDRSWAAIFKRVDELALHQVAEWRGWVPQKVFGGILALLARWYNNAFIVHEGGAYGQSVTDALRDDHGYHNMYIEKDIQVIAGHAVERIKHGFTTSTRTKPTLVHTLVESIDNRNITILSPFLLQEMRAFAKKYNQSKTVVLYEASPGSKDDGVISAGLVVYGTQPGKGAPSLKQHQRISKMNKRDTANDPSPTDPLDPTDAAIWATIKRQTEIGRLLSGYDNDGNELDPDDANRRLEDLWTSEQSSFLPLP